MTSVKVSQWSIAVNILLSVGKWFAGFIGHSQAMIADAVHSASDVLSTVIVLIAVKISGKSADKDHPYGHDRFESLASLVLTAMLAAAGIGIGITGVKSIIHSDEVKVIPGVISMVAAVVSIIAKEAMYQVTVRVGRREKSDALIADAWHHRSDAISSIGSLVGILLGRFGIAWADGAVSLIICLLILKTAIEIGISAVNKLTDHACDRVTEKRMRDVITGVRGVKRIDVFRTRCFGSGWYVDVEISVDPELKLKTAHEIAENVHDEIENEFCDVRHCMVHVNPLEERMR